MFLRVTKVKRQWKQYSYAQFVESYRRNEDGLPAHRVVANLGQLSELEIENLKTAIRASKDQKKLSSIWPKIDRFNFQNRLKISFISTLQPSLKHGKKYPSQEFCKNRCQRQTRKYHLLTLFPHFVYIDAWTQDQNFPRCVVPVALTG